MLAQDFNRVARKPTSKKEPMVGLNLRVPPSLVADLRDAERVLVLLARFSGEDEPDSSKAIRRVMRLGLDVVFNKVGGRPQSAADWDALERTLAERQSH